MVYGIGPAQAQVSQRPALIIADRHEMHVWENGHQLSPVGKIHTPVEGVHTGDRARSREGKGQKVVVAVDHIELVRAGKGMGEPYEMKGRWIGNIPIETERSGHHAVKPGAGPGIAARE